MKSSPKAKEIIEQVSSATARLGDLRKIAAEIKKDHSLALELWASGKYMARQLALLIMDKKLLTEEQVDALINDISAHNPDERLQLIDWLMANQLAKDKKTIAMMQSWAESPSSLKRRLFWYYQGRLRWVGQVPPPNSQQLLQMIEAGIMQEQPEVQWAMNFTAAQIGIFEPQYRQRSIAIGEDTGLYKDEVVAKNCTPNYLPKYIAIQVAKMEKAK